MSINDAPEIRETFSRFHIAEVSTTYTTGKKADRAQAPPRAAGEQLSDRNTAKRSA